MLEPVFRQHVATPNEATLASRSSRFQPVLANARVTSSPQGGWAPGCRLISQQTDLPTRGIFGWLAAELTVDSSANKLIRRHENVYVISVSEQRFPSRLFRCLGRSRDTCISTTDGDLEFRPPAARSDCRNLGTRPVVSTPQSRHRARFLLARPDGEGRPGKCADDTETNGLSAPKWQSDANLGVTLTFFAPEVTPEVLRLLQNLEGAMLRRELQEAMSLKDDEHFRKAYLLPALAAGVIEMSQPDKPTSSKQR